MTVLGFAGLFTVLTYILKPILTRLSGFTEMPSRRSFSCSA